MEKKGLNPDLELSGRVHPKAGPSHPHQPTGTGTTTPKVGRSIAILLALLFSKYFYSSSLTSYYTFYLISTFHVSIRTAQIHLLMANVRDVAENRDFASLSHETEIPMAEIARHVGDMWISSR